MATDKERKLEAKQRRAFFKKFRDTVQCHGSGDGDHHRILFQVPCQRGDRLIKYLWLHRKKHIIGILYSQRCIRIRLTSCLARKLRHLLLIDITESDILRCKNPALYKSAHQGTAHIAGTNY